MHLGAFCIANAPSRETRGARRARAVPTRSPTRLTRAPVSPGTRAPVQALGAVPQLQLIPSTDCNFRRTQIATLVVGQLHSGWVGQLQLP